MILSFCKRRRSFALIFGPLAAHNATISEAMARPSAAPTATFIATSMATPPNFAILAGGADGRN